ncbi:hypothetical protein C3B59_06700 [Cryobacterium zongtaii]|uniref:RNA polymerase sigma factor n=1 Tax=Cryobacterium zongtaii TaxID=1259217 RepID=A0A2S3ZKC2_9MICO|nr:RNA polymerase sigma factor [Cryobacterium zongtaii]POH68198.1 hypothetical protein C3B59_06700 [Cryobacterium zongtaii]
MGTNDAVEWALALAGSGEAFARVYDKHYDRVLRHSQRLVSIAADAEDVASLTFLEVWRKRDSVRFVDESLVPWLLVVATYTAKNLSRSARRHEALLRKLPLAASHNEHVRSDELSEVEMALTRLPIAARQVITLCILEGFKISEAASVLKIPDGTVKSRLSRAKQKLAQELRTDTYSPTEERASL